jgi:outer membrane lipoprotein-sorting protein
MTARRLLLCAALFVSVCAVALAETTEERGHAIAAEVDLRDDGFENHTADLTMILRTKSGKESHRDMRVTTLEVEEDGDQSLIRFDSPADVKGTALLTFSHREGPDDQWLYLPALKRVKRIASKNKSGPFMGSEFAYEDMSSQEVEKYTYRWLRDEVLDETDCFVVERYPKDATSGYTRQVFWVDKQEYRPLRTEFYDRKKSHLKTLTFSEYERHLDKHWRPGEMLMVNHQSGKSTLLVWTNFAFQTDIRTSDFDPTALPRLN